MSVCGLPSLHGRRCTSAESSFWVLHITVLHVLGSSVTLCCSYQLQRLPTSALGRVGTCLLELARCLLSSKQFRS